LRRIRTVLVYPLKLFQGFGEIAEVEKSECPRQANSGRGNRNAP